MAANTPKFWRVDRPNYDSDFWNSYINGSLEHPFGLPGVECDVCGSTWGGSRTLKYECPPTFRKHENIRERWPIPRADHAELQLELMKALSIDGDPFVALCPGDSFQPCFLDAPSWPQANFLWPCLGTFVVRNRIRDLLLEKSGNEIAACP